MRLLLGKLFSNDVNGAIRPDDNGTVVFLAMARASSKPDAAFALPDPPLSLGPAARGLFPSPQEERERHVFSGGMPLLERKAQFGTLSPGPHY
jgi:hypothetical protein